MAREASVQAETRLSEPSLMIALAPNSPPRRRRVAGNGASGEVTPDWA
jgi:hypothetical protein